MGNKLATVDESGFVTAFYDDEFHSQQQIPAGAIHISSEAHMLLLDGQSAGKRMKVAHDGTPSLEDRAPVSRAELVASKWEVIKAERNRRKAGGVLVGVHWFHSDADSRIQWLGIKDTARDLLAVGKPGTEPVPRLGQPLQWKTLSGEFAPVTVQMAFDVVAATNELDARLFDVSEQKHQEVEAAEDPAAYDALSGWPASFGE